MCIRDSLYPILLRLAMVGWENCTSDLLAITFGTLRA